MRRALAAAIGLCFLPWVSWAAECTGTGTAYLKSRNSQAGVTTVNWTAAGDGSFTACTLPGMSATTFGQIIAVETDPGGTAPTNLYDITLTDAQSNDVMGGSLANRSTTATQRAAPLLTSGTEWPAPFYGTLTLNITNNAVNAATGSVRVYWVQQ